MKLLTIILLMLPLFSNAEDFVYKYSIPTDSPLIYSALKEGGGYANFAGEITVRAKYQFIFDDGTGLPDNPYLMIYPDTKSLNKLPYLTHRGKPEYAKEILIHGASKIAIELLGNKLAQEIKSGKYPFVSGEAEFVLSELAAGYECDQPSFVGEYKQINKVVSSHSLSKIMKPNGC